MDARFAVVSPLEAERIAAGFLPPDTYFLPLGAFLRASITPIPCRHWPSASLCQLQNGNTLPKHRQSHWVHHPRVRFTWKT